MKRLNRNDLDEATGGAIVLGTAVCIGYLAAYFGGLLFGWSLRDAQLPAEQI